MATTHLVFVFGTLKAGFPNSATNTGRRVPGEFSTAQAFPFFLVGERHSPWLLNVPGEGSRITGEVYEVDDVGLARMDALERITFSDGYERVLLDLLPVPPAQECAVQAHAYLKPARYRAGADIRLGPFPAYTQEHAALYRKREG